MSRAHKTIEELGKLNLIRLVAEHKKNCDNPNCMISLLAILVWLKGQGIKFTKEEMRLFA